LIRERQYLEAERIARDAFDAQLEMLGPRHPNTLEALKQLGKALAYNQRYPEASKLFHDMIEKQNDAAGQRNLRLAWYAFACTAAAADQPEDALQFLRQAISYGFKDGAGLAADEDLQNMRATPGFQQLVAELKGPPLASNESFAPAAPHGAYFHRSLRVLERLPATES
jgi:tetratricopeptide (TPR) repeat protein